MTRTPLSKRLLPAYTRGEEIANMTTHIVGGAIGLIVLGIAISVSLEKNSVWSLISGIIYACSMITLYTVSSVYHGLRAERKEKAKKVMQVLDHCTIYFLIAGTYTPILLVAMRPEHALISWIVFIAEWATSAVAMVFTAIDHKRYSVFSMICYIALGWMIIFTLRPAVETIGTAGFWWLLAGGISYTLGAALYIIGKKRPILHTVFHVFVVIGSALQAFCVLGFVL